MEPSGPAHRRRPARAGGGRLRRVAPLGLALAAAACRPSPPEQPPARAPGEWVAFQGSWSAAGERHTLHLGPGRQASVLVVGGTMLLQGQGGLGVGFQSRAIAFSDSAGGSTGRAVWTDERGDQIFSELRGQPVKGGGRVSGSIVGGTGRWAGITGEYRFEWSYVLEAEEGRVQGRAVGLEGRARLEAPPARGEGSR